MAESDGLRDDRAVTLYAPNRAEILAVGAGAELRNQHQSARGWILAKINQPPSDWDERCILSVPGPVWSVSSDTCCTGRLSAPANIAYDHYGREFVSRQPRDASELAALMSADTEEVFACYRFDGLARWTARGVAAWFEDVEVMRGYALRTAETADDAEIASTMDAYAAYLVSDEFRMYIAALRRHLDSLVAH